MAKFSPLGNLLKQFNKTGNENIDNIYDDGSVWSLPEDTAPNDFYYSPIETKSNFKPGAYEAFINSSDDVVDPLQAPRNQMKYFTNQLNDLGQEVEKPSLLKKGLSLLTRVSAIPASLNNSLAGSVGEALEQRGKNYESIINTEEAKKLEASGYEIKNVGGIYTPLAKRNEQQSINLLEADKLMREAFKKSDANDLGKQIKGSGKIVAEGVKSGANTLTGLFTGEYSDKAIDWGRVLEKNRINPDENVANFMKIVEAPGYGVAKIFGASDETAQNVGNIVADFGLSALTGNITDIDGAGKALKYIRNNDKLKKVSNIANMEDALKMANKHNTFDDYVQSLGDKAKKYDNKKLTEMFNNSQEAYAKDLIKDVNKGLGGINNFDGLKLGSLGTVSKETLDKISQNKVQSTLTQIGLGLYSPVGALMNNPIVDKLGEAINKTELGNSLNKDLSKAFKGGKNNEWINSMKENPEKAMQYANERKQMDIAKKLGDKRIQETLEEINKYSNIKDNPEDITNIIENPKDIETRQIEVEKEVINPEYITKMMQLGKSDLNKQKNALSIMQNRLKVQKEELSNIAKKSEVDTIKSKAIDSEIENLQKRIDKINEVSSVKSLDFNKQMKQFGYDGEYTDLFDKAIKTNIEDLTREVGDRDLAEALQESANRVLDEVDKKHPGLSDYYTGYGNVNVNKTFGENLSAFENQKEAMDFEKLSTQEKVDLASKKLYEYLEKDDIARDNNDLKAIENNKTQIKSYKIVLEREQKNLIKEKMKNIGIKTKSDEIEAYNEMIENFNMTQAEEFLNMLNSKEKYIAESKSKAMKNDLIRKYLGTESKDMITDLEDIAKKRFKEGGNSPSLTHSKQYKLYKKLNKNTKMTKLNDYETSNIIADGRKLNTASDKTIKSIAKQMASKDSRRSVTYLYDNTIDKKLKKTLRLIRDLTSDDVTSYVMGKEANQVAKQFIEETGANISYKKVADRIKLLSYKEMKQEFIKIAKEYKDKIDNEYIQIANKLTDDEIELYNAQQSAYRLNPLEIEGELRKIAKSTMSDEQINGIIGNKTQRAIFKESQRKATLKKEEAKIEMDLKEKSNSQKYYDEAGVDITEKGTERKSFIKETEDELKTKKIYDGIDEEGLEVDNYLDNVDKKINYLRKQTDANSKAKVKLYDDLSKLKSDIETKEANIKNIKAKDKITDEDIALISKLEDELKVLRPKKKLLNSVFDFRIKSKKEQQESLKTFMNKKDVESNVNVPKKETKQYKEVNIFDDEEIVNEKPKKKIIRKTTPIERIVKPRQKFTFDDDITIDKNNIKVIKQQVEEANLKAIREENNTGIDKLLEKVEKANVEPVKPKSDTPIANIVENNIPEKFRNITGIKFDTPSGKILIDKNISVTELKSIIEPKKYGKSETGSRIMYTNKPFNDNGDLGIYDRKTDTILVNVGGLDKNTAKTIAEHELGHRVVNKLMKQMPDLDIRDLGIPFLKNFRNLNDKTKFDLIDVVSKANKANTPTKEMVDLGLVTKYLNKVTKEGGLYKISNEGFAELHSLYNNQNTRIANKMRKINPEAYDNFIKKMDSLKGEELKEVSKLTRKRFGDEYADRIHKLREERKAYSNFSDVLSKVSDVKNTKATIKDMEKKLEELKKALSTERFDDEGNYIGASYYKMFDTVKKNNPEYVEAIDKKIPMYNKSKRLEDKVFEIDNTKDLSEEGLKLIESFRKEMKDIAIREGIYDKEDADKFSKYVMHMINPNYRTEADIIEKGKALLKELTLTENANALSRTKKGTIKEINDQTYSEIGKRIFEENIQRIWLQRRMNSEKTVFKMNQEKRILEDFGYPLINDFNKEVNKPEHMMKVAGDRLQRKTGMTKKEIIEDFNNSGLSSNDYVFSKLGRKSDLLDPIKYAKQLNMNYGFDTKKLSSLDKIPYATEDGRKYVQVDSEEARNAIDKTKQMPYMLNGNENITENPIKDYKDGMFKQMKDRDMVMVEIARKPPISKQVRTISDKDFADSFNDRTKLAENLSSLLDGDIEALRGFDALAGYNVVDPKKIKMEEFKLDSGKERYIVDRQAWENFQKSIKEQEYKEKNTAVKIFDYFNSMFKSQALFSVGFHERNAIQNVIASYVKSGINLLDPKKNKEAIDIIKYKSGGKNISKEYNGYNVDEIIREAELGGLFETQVKNEFDKDHTKKFLNRETDKLETKKTPLGKLINPFSKDFAGYKGSQWVGDKIETQAKIVNLLTHLDDGMDLSDAIEMTKETLFDYSDLTGFETKYMKRFMPFYTFMRKNIPSQVDNLANHGARVARVEQVFNKASEKNETDKDRILRPSYLDGQLALGNNKYANVGKATDDLKKLTNPKDMASAINPIIRTPIELLFNKKLFSDADISKYDKPKEKVDYMIESNVPVAKQISAIHKLVTGKDDDGKAGKTIKKALGDITNSYDTKKEEQATMYKYVEQLQNQYYEYLEKHPEAKEELENKKNKKKPNYVSPLSKLKR